MKKYYHLAKKLEPAGYINILKPKTNIEIAETIRSIYNLQEKESNNTIIKLFKMIRMVNAESSDYVFYYENLNEFTETNVINQNEFETKYKIVTIGSLIITITNKINSLEKIYDKALNIIFKTANKATINKRNTITENITMFIHNIQKITRCMTSYFMMINKKTFDMVMCDDSLKDTLNYLNIYVLLEDRMKDGRIIFGTNNCNSCISSRILSPGLHLFIHDNKYKL